MNWPLVTRKRFDAVKTNLNETRLALTVANSEANHLTDTRLRYIIEIAKLTQQVVELERNLAATEEDRDHWRVEASKVVEVPVYDMPVPGKKAEGEG